MRLTVREFTTTSAACPTQPGGHYNILHVLNTTLYLEDGVTVDTNATAVMVPNNISVKEAGVLSDATIFFNTGGATASDDPTSPMYNQPYFQPGKLGYDTIFRKLTEHETGHAEGLCHIPRADQVDNQLVMNDPRENCPNDICKHQPIEVQSCDTNAVSTVLEYFQLPPPPPFPTPIPTPIPYCEQFPLDCNEGGSVGSGYGGRTCYRVYEPHYYYGGVQGDPTWDVSVEYEYLYTYCTY